MREPNTQDTPVQLSIIIAAYQEADNLAILLPQLQHVLPEIIADYEILVIDTEVSKDLTPEVCKKNGCIHVNRTGGNNYGDAMRSGIRVSQGQYVIIMDADGSHNPDYIAKLWDHRNDADVVIASRYVSGGDTENPAVLVWMSRLLNLIFKSILHMPALDVSNSFRLYTGEKLRSLDLKFCHFDIVEEILAKMVWEHDPPGTVSELPFRFLRRIHGKSKRNLLVFGINFLSAFWKLSKLRNSSTKRLI